MSKRFDYLLHKEEWSKDEFYEFCDFLRKGIDKRPIPNRTIEAIYKTLREFFPKGISEYHGKSDSDGWKYVAYDAAVCLTGDSWRIDCEGGYPSDFHVDDYRKGRIFIAAEGYKGTSLDIYSIDDAIEMFVCDHLIDMISGERIEPDE